MSWKSNLGVLLSTITALSVGLAGCVSTSQTPSQLPIWDITQSQLDDLLIPVDYGALVNQSLSGDRDALVALMQLGDETNGGGAYGFGALLQAIALRIGDEKFAAACQKLADSERQLTGTLLKAGFEYGDPAYRLEDLPRLLPLTMSALQ